MWTSLSWVIHPFFFVHSWPSLSELLFPRGQIAIVSFLICADICICDICINAHPKFQWFNGVTSCEILVIGSGFNSAVKKYRLFWAAVCLGYDNRLGW